ncbi:META domain-containing protein [Chloroflexota bacterium]|nr:META domain-containing protein [Chloroflexota bacterium]
MFFKNLQSRQIKIIGFVLLIPLFIAACGSQQTDQLINDIDWQWIEMVEAEPASQSLVPNPENYTLRLSTDSTLSITADCNMVGGSYTLAGSALNIETGPSTMAYCGEESLDQQFLGFLNNVESYAIEDGQLMLRLKDGAGHMTFNEE